MQILPNHATWYIQRFTWLLTESVKSLRYWNPWKIYVKQLFFIVHILIFAENAYFTNFLGNFSRILLKLKVTSCNLLDIVRKRQLLSVVFCRYSLNLYKMKLTLLVCISLFQKCEIILSNAMRQPFPLWTIL